MILFSVLFKQNLLDTDIHVGKTVAQSFFSINIEKDFSKKKQPNGTLNHNIYLKGQFSWMLPLHKRPFSL